MIMMCTYFDIMADRAGLSGWTVSRLSGLNRTNDNILLYNPVRHLQNIIKNTSEF